MDKKNKNFIDESEEIINPNQDLSYLAGDESNNGIKVDHKETNRGRPSKAKEDQKKPISIRIDRNILSDAEILAVLTNTSLTRIIENGIKLQTDKIREKIDAKKQEVQEIRNKLKIK